MGPPLPLFTNLPILTTIPTGSPQIRRHPRILLLRRLCEDLARVPSLFRSLPLDRSRLIQSTHRLCKHCLLVPSRIRLFTGVRFVRWQCLSTRVSRGQLDASDLPGTWSWCECCELGAGDCTREFNVEQARSRRCEEIRDWWE